MTPEAINPFTVTKAVDFTDEQIRDTWVDLPGEAGFLKLVNLTSPMPMLILGGKGSGRTHLMRYFSYSLQKLRRDGLSVMDALRRDAYIGIYLRCEGLNAGRFMGKHCEPEEWNALFPYYMDLWLAQLTLETIQDVVDSGDGAPDVPGFCRGVLRLFDQQDFGDAESIPELLDLLRALRREIDRAVNNVAISRSLGNIAIRATRGRLILGIPQAAQRYLPSFVGVLFLYLLDELENLTETQQLYVNTLIREKELPTSLKVGARLHGIRTQRTLSGDEENHEGSEFEVLHLDQQLRDDPRYPDFARLVVGRRLVRAGYDSSGDIARLVEEGARGAQAKTALESLSSRLRSYFEEIPESQFDREATRFIEENYPPSERPYLTRLREKLETALRRGLVGGIGSAAEVAGVVDILRVAEYPLVERTNVFMFYQQWAAGRNIRDAASRIAEESRVYVASGGESGSWHKRVLGHFRADLLAQLVREGRQGRQRYLGFDTFIMMSSGMPRLLLVLLKYIHKWALFNGETPFRDGNKVGIGTQLEAVEQASNWFFHDARMTGADAQRVQDGVERLATFFRRLRFTDKPVEPSLNTFSTVLSEASPGAQRCVDLAEKSSLLIPVLSGHVDRNTGRVVDKYQLNPMLCPRFDLPLGHRGTIAFTPGEMNAIFDEGYRTNYEAVVQVRAERMTAPFARSRSGREAEGVGGGSEEEPGQPLLPGLE